MCILSTVDLTIGYLKKDKKKVVQSNLNLELYAGKLTGLIGPNGVGKSTLLRTLSGLQKPLGGKVLLENKELSKLSYQEKATKIALVLTDKIDILNATVYDIVSYGRYPYSNWLGNLTDKDHIYIEQAIQMVHLEEKRNELLNELSDGERQRVMIARALAQDTPVILLDEPTSFLDVSNRIEIMLLLHKLAHQTQKAILLSTHELDLALQAADSIWLMDKNGKTICGVPEDLVFNGSFARAFASKYYFFNEANGNFSMNFSLNKQVAVTGNKTRMYWTLRALARAGFEAKEEAPVKILVTEDGWILNDEKINSMEELLDKLMELEKLNLS